VKFTYVDDYDFLAAHKIEESDSVGDAPRNDDGMMSVKNDRAIGAGLTFRPLATTVRDTLAWWPTVPKHAG
jgi:2'-hydroxyisoflavone reductase